MPAEQAPPRSGGTQGDVGSPPPSVFPSSFCPEADLRPAVVDPGQTRREIAGARPFMGIAELNSSGREGQDRDRLDPKRRQLSSKGPPFFFFFFFKRTTLTLGAFAGR